jgi:hypothetical protein
MAVASMHAVAGEPDGVALRAVGREEAHDRGRGVFGGDGPERSLMTRQQLHLAQKAHAYGPLPWDDPERLVASIEK